MTTGAHKQTNITGCSPWDPRCGSKGLIKHVYLAVKPNKETQTFEDYHDAANFLHENGEYNGTIHRIMTEQVFC